jgi:hypothetical protein
MRQSELRRSCAAAAVLTVFVAAATAGAGVPSVADDSAGVPTPGPPRLTVKPEHGFVDDAFALDPAGRRLALIRTDHEQFQRVEIHDLDAPKPAAAAGFALEATRVIEAIEFLPDGAGLLLIGATPDGGHVAEATDLTGKVLGKATLTGRFAMASRGREAMLMTQERREGQEKAGQPSYVVSPLKLPTLKPAGKPRVYPLTEEGALRSNGLVPVGFFDGYSRLLARRPGAYDKKKDARQPDGQAVVDLLTGKIVSTGPIEDAYGWARLSRLRPEHPNRTAFVQLAGANAGPAVPGDAATKAATGVELVDPAGRLTPLELAVPFRLYDRLTLKDQEGPAPGVLTFALEVDPVNADAVARKKADARALDVYGVAVASRQARLRGRVSLDKEPIVWSVAGDRLAVLHRFKSFARGGDRIDVYDLGN